MPTGIGIAISHCFGSAISGGDPWTPAELDNDFVWYRADLTSTITATGNDVDSIEDQSGEGRDGTPTGVGKEPRTGVDTIDSKNVLTFDDANEEGLQFDMPSEDVAHFFYVLKTSDDAFVLAWDNDSADTFSFKAKDGVGTTPYQT